MYAEESISIFEWPSHTPGLTKRNLMKRHKLVVFLALFAVAIFAAWYFAPAHNVAIRELWMRRDSWMGRHVRVVGVLEVFSKGSTAEHYVLEEQGFRVGILDAEPRELAALTGRRVMAEGRFGFSDKFGVYIRAKKFGIAPL